LPTDESWQIAGVFQLNRRVEYVLAIVAHLQAPASTGQPVLHSARSIADATAIPFDMVTKCLQRLKAAGMCQASQGKQGGYRLAVEPADLSVGALLAAVFSPVTLAGCDADGQPCPLLDAGCQIHGPLRRLSERLQQNLEQMSLADLLMDPQEDQAADEAPADARMEQAPSAQSLATEAVS
jgi:Rrf2 family protein